jgi:2-oxoglutarate dehydrogenase E1 component
MFSATSKNFLSFSRSVVSKANKINSITSFNSVMRTTQRGFSQDNFLNGANANYVDQMYSQWKADPSSVHASWQAYFANESGDFQAPPTLGKTATQSQLDEILSIIKGGESGLGSMDSVSAERSAKDSVQIAAMVRAFQTHGHLVADVDPLDLKTNYKNNSGLRQKYRFPSDELIKLLDYRTYGFTEQDLDREFYLHSV